MRTATFVVVVALHAVFFFLFALRMPLRRFATPEAPSIAVFITPAESILRPQPERHAESSMAPRTVHPIRSRPRAPAALKSPSAAVQAEPATASGAITPTPTPDWWQEAQIAADHEIEAQARMAHKHSPLAPHDFSRATPRTSEQTQPKFAWNHAAIHRVEELPTGGLLFNINERCALVWVLFPLPVCKLGKIPVRADLFDHMEDAPVLGESKMP